MKKSILCIFFIALSFFSFAQDYTKFQMQRATMFSSYIAEQMELSETEQKFVYDVMLARVYNSNAKIKSCTSVRWNKNLSYQILYFITARKVKSLMFLH